MLNIVKRSDIPDFEEYIAEGQCDDKAVSFKKLKTLCYIGDRKIKGGNVHHISTTKKRLLNFITMSQKICCM